MSASSAIATLAAAQEATVLKIREAIPDLAEKRDLSWRPEDGQTVAGAPATLVALDAPGAPNVAWLSSLVVDGAAASLTVFNGPLTGVPHLVSRVLATDDALSLFLDWRPRAYGAYETRRPDGSYPGPEELGRVAFTYSGARAEMDANFYTSSLRDSIDKWLGSFENASPASDAAALGDLEKVTRGPCCVDVSLPLTDANVQAVAAARAEAVDAWLDWQVGENAEKHAHKPGAPVNTQYVYDTKYRQNAYGALLAVLTARFGDDAPKLTAADSGPLDEAYVGGGS